jgi:hypothetical protein
MKFKSFALAGAGAIALGAAIGFATPGTADPAAGNPYTQNPTPQERAQTQTLNAQQDQPAADQSDAASTPADAQYQAQQDQYQRDQQKYQGQLDQYHYDKARYDAWRHRYDEVRWGEPAPFHVRYTDENLRPLYLIAEPSQQLAYSLVVGPEGNYVGKVRNVETASDGRPQRVQILLDETHAAWVRPGALRFDAEDHIVVTNLTRHDLWRMSSSI